jgi:anti-sigma-K factor RskA
MLKGPRQVGQNNEKLIFRYLLGGLDHHDRRQFEEAYFNDDRFFGVLLEAEEKLIQDYVAGALSSEERERFERNFLTSPARRQRVEAAKSALGRGPVL